MPEWQLHWSTPFSTVLFCLLVLVTGCDTSIEPFDEEGTYSIYGVLNESQTLQLLRVKPLSVPVTKVDSGTVNATVTLENLTDGASRTLRDSVITFEEGGTEIVTHNYVVDAPITPATEYRITVDGDAGGPTQATTTTPTGTDATVSPQQGDCPETYTVVFDDVDDMRRIRAWVEIRFDHPLLDEWTALPRNNTFRTPDGEIAVTFSPSDLLSELGEDSDISVSPPELPADKNPFCWRANLCWLLDSNEIRIRYAYLGPEWYGDVPEDSLGYDPLESHDVANGLGFFGSVREDRVAATVDTSRAVWTGGRLCDEDPP